MAFEQALDNFISLGDEDALRGMVSRAAEGAVRFQAGLIEGGDGLDAKHQSEDKSKTMRFTSSKIQGGAGDVLAGDLHLDVGGADLVKLLRHDVLREFGLIAFAAEMGQVEVA